MLFLYNTLRYFCTQHYILKYYTKINHILQKQIHFSEIHFLDPNVSNLLSSITTSLAQLIIVWHVTCANDCNLLASFMEEGGNGTEGL